MPARCLSSTLPRPCSAQATAAIIAERRITRIDPQGRHEVLDCLLRQGMCPEGKVMIFSGRLASDMLSKVMACGVKLFIAPGAPSLASVEMAEGHGITLLGFVRRDNINIYTCSHRVV